MFFNERIEDVLKSTQSTKENGLSTEEVKSRQSKYGKNQLEEKKRKSILSMFFEQINEPMIYILLFAAAISVILKEYSDCAIILIVVILNAVIGVIQQNNAEKALEALKKMAAPKALVRRDGKVVEIDSADLVVGDIVIIEAGRFIPADIRLLETANLKIEESALTGESVPSEKDANFIGEDDLPLGDRINMAYMSTHATYGRGVGVVSAIGMDTEMGYIAKMLEEAEKQSTPLQRKLGELGKKLGIMAVAICVIIFLVGILRGNAIVDMLLTSIALAVAAIPEGLPAVVTIVLALGVKRMIKSNAIVRKLPAVETLGSVNIVCSDKTGTLTQNKMTVTKFYANNKADTIDKLDNANRLFVHGFCLCNDATSDVGDPTEIALIVMGENVGENKPELDRKYPRIGELSFDSDRKMMTTVHEYDGKIASFTKGALDRLLDNCDNIFTDNGVRSITNDDKSLIINASNGMSADALRVLGLACKELDSPNEDNLESGLTFVGFVGMIDPPRLEVKDSIKKCKKAGITTIMITGDHRNTAFAIAKELGIADKEEQVLSGEELDLLSQDELNNNISKYRVFARVSPEHKVKIVNAFKSSGNTVSMTGDGVNDAPSLRSADIGVAMGITGTDVAKGAADMVLTDDNFSTIVKAIEEGRNIYANIKKSVLFLLSCNLGEIFTVFVAMLINIGKPLEAVHILWINLVTDSLPALALGVDPGDKNIMSERPRSSREGLFSGGGWTYIILNGMLIGGLTLFAFIYGMKESLGNIHHSQTMAFMVLSFSQLVHSLNLRSFKVSIFKLGLFSNIYLIGSLIIGMLLQYMVVSSGFFIKVFNTSQLTSFEWLLVFALSLLPLVFNEIVKLFRK